MIYIYIVYGDKYELVGVWADVEIRREKNIFTVQERKVFYSTLGCGIGNGKNW